jgi:methionyl-tRNA formyltransferase
VQWAIAQGETVTGVTTMLLNEGLDTGDILLQKEMAILPADTSVTLWPRLAEMGADLLIETLRGLEQKSITAVPQDHTQATLAPILKKEDGQVDFNRTAAEIHNRLRGFQPWPGAYAKFRGKNLKFVSSRREDAPSNLSPGELRVGDEKLYVGCAERTVLELLQLQPEGKKTMAAREFINGYHPAAGEYLG